MNAEIAPRIPATIAGTFAICSTVTPAKIRPAQQIAIKINSTVITILL